MNRRVAVLYALFAVSGFCGLIYESIWSHYLKLFVGHAAHAQTLVLAVFMGGMGLGAWLTSRFTTRIANLLWGYALVEAVIGVSALAFHPAFGAITDWAYASLLPATCSAQGMCLSHWLLAAVLILPQSVLLGSTFPLMTGGVLRLAPHAPGRQLALLYFLNSIGAVVGVLASGFALIPHFGLPGALLTAGLGNIALALAVYFIGKPAGGAAPAKPMPSTARALPVGRALLVVSLLTGLASFIYEIVWIRMLSMVLGSATHSFELMLASFILGLALGGWWIRSRIDDSRDALAMLAVVQLAMGVLALLTLPLYSHTFDLMAWLMAGLSRGDAGYALYTVSMTVIALLVMLPATFCAGMTLPLITAYLYRGGSGERSIGQVYAWNTVGAIAGVLLTVHALMPGLGLKHALAIGAVIDIALGVFLLWNSSLRAHSVRGAAAKAFAGAAVAAAVAVPLVVSFDPLRMGSSVFRMGRASHDPSTTVAYAGDGQTASVHVLVGSDGRAALMTNGKGDGSIQMRPGAAHSADEATMVLLGALPLAYRPDAEEVAVIGFGTGMSSATLLGSPHLKRLDTIEIEPKMVDAAQRFRPVVERAFTDPRHQVVFDDAKAFLARGQRRYDVIVSEPSNPWVSGVSSLFSQQFYARASAHLKQGGLFVQWMHVYEITPELVASVFTALGRSFPLYDVYMGSAGDMVIVASPGAQLPRRSAAVFEMPGVRAMLDRVGLGSENRLALQFVSNQRTLGPLVASFATQPNSDFFPLVDLYAPKARFQGASATSLTSLHTLYVPALRALDGAKRTGLDGATTKPADPESRALPYLRARQWAAFVRHGVAPPAQESLLRDNNLAIVLHNRLFACEGRHMRDAPWDDVLRLAAETIPYLDETDASELWSAVLAAPCSARMSALQRRWLELFAHLAGSRWEEAGHRAMGLLGDTEVPPGWQTVMLTQVAVTAQILQGRTAEGMRILGAELERLPPAERGQMWVRLLASAAQREPSETGATSWSLR
jgi:predicted membrane-bound spermidine synthase